MRFQGPLSTQQRRVRGWTLSMRVACFRVFVVASVVAGMGTSGTASATTYRSCVGPATTVSYFDGKTQQTRLTSIRGSSVHLEYQPPILCDNTAITGSLGDSVSAAWAMTVDNRGGITAGWAQAGWVKSGAGSALPGSGTHRFVQWTLACKSTATCGPDQVFTKFFGSVNQFAYYGTRYEAADGLIHFYADGVQLMAMDYNVYGIWTNEWATQFHGETKHPETNIGGWERNQISVGEMAYYNNSQAAYCVTSTMLNVKVTDRAWYKQADYTPAGGCLGFKIWTNRGSVTSPDPSS